MFQFFLGIFKSWRASKLLYWVGEGVRGIHLEGELHREGSALQPAQQACSFCFRCSVLLQVLTIIPLLEVADNYFSAVTVGKIQYVHCNSLLQGTVLYQTAMHYIIALNCTLLHCTALHCITLLNCTLMHCPLFCTLHSIANWCSDILNQG